MDIIRETTVCSEHSENKSIVREQASGRIWTQFVVGGEVSGWTNADGWEQAVAIAHAHVLKYEADVTTDQLAQLCGYYGCYFDEECNRVLCTRKPDEKAAETLRREKERVVTVCQGLRLYKLLTEGKVDYINATVPCTLPLRKVSHGVDGNLLFSSTGKDVWTGETANDTVESVSVSIEGYCEAIVYYAIDHRLSVSEMKARQAAIIISDKRAWQRFFGVLPMSTVENDAKLIASLIERYGAFCKAREQLRLYDECWKQGAEWGKTMDKAFDPFT